MSRKTRTLTLCALFSALAFVILYFASIWPTGQLGLVAAASLFIAAAVVEAGPASGFYVFFVSSTLAILLLPNRATAFLYMSFFGYYPIVKSLTERLRQTWLQWALKLLVFNTALTVIWYVFREFVFSIIGFNVHIALIYLGGSLVFAVFDYGFTKVIWFYISRVSRKGRK